jgi:hypothetical protein
MRHPGLHAMACLGLNVPLVPKTAGMRLSFSLFVRKMVVAGHRATYDKTLQIFGSHAIDRL